jgi:transcriptional regulator with XRE-family HTH domain
MDFGEKLRHLREEKSLTQDDLGKILNVTKANVSKYELGRLQPNIETIKLISKYFNISIDWLLGGTATDKTTQKDTTETIALHRTDGYDDDLPEEAIKEIENFKEFIRQKYKKK